MTHLTKKKIKVNQQKALKSCFAYEGDINDKHITSNVLRV